MDEAQVRFPRDLDDARRLTPWAAEYRYGETINEPLDREHVLRLVGDVLAWAESVVR